MSPTARVLGFVVATFAFVNGASLVAGVPFGDTDLHPLAWFLTGRQGGDSWRPMLQAYDFVTTPDGRSRSLYEKLFFSPAVKHKGFQYPPTSLLAIAAAGVFGEGRRLAVLETVTWWFIPVTMTAVFFLLRSGARSGESQAEGLALAIVATLAFYPAMRAYRNGQIQTWINGLFALGLLAFVRGRDGVAGALLGATCLIKPQYGVIVLWGVLRREWRFATGAVVVGGLGLLASLLLCGIAPHLEYLGVLRFIADRGESFYPNQSINGLMNRAVGNGLNLQWMDAMPEPNALVRAATVLTSALLLAWALVPRPSPASGARAADLAMATLAATMASPIAWEHHYGVLLPMFALLVPALQQIPVLGPRTMLALAIAHLLSSHTWRVTDRLADTPFNFLQCTLLAGALLVLVFLHRLRGRAIPGSAAGASVP